MPTYKNETTELVATEGIRFEPGQMHMTTLILTDPRLTKLSDEPFYNPTAAIHPLVSSGVGDDQEVILDPKTREIRVWKVLGATVNVFLNSLDAHSSAKLGEDYETEIRLVRGRVSKVIVQFSAGGSCELVEVK
jgi:hypothetical protein